MIKRGYRFGFFKTQTAKTRVDLFVNTIIKRSSLEFPQHFLVSPSITQVCSNPKHGETVLNYLTTGSIA